MKQYKTLQCEMCGTDFKSNYKTSKTCSRKCFEERRAKASGRYVMRERFSDVSGGTVGAMSELIVSVDLMKKGYSVFRAISPACFCDIIAVKNGKMLKVEVRTAYKNLVTGNLSFPTKLSEDKKNSANCYGLYERNENKVYYLSLDKKEITINE